MKTIGLLGGMSWESSIEYERIINEEVRRRLGGTHSADLVMRSYDFAEIEELQSAGDWRAAASWLAADARRLQQAGADLVVLCTNTMHRVADAIEDAIDVPFLHLADTTAAAVKASGIDRVGLLGTRFTMEHDFYRGRLEHKHGIHVMVPDQPHRDKIHEIIYQELVRGIVRDASRSTYLGIIGKLRDAGAEGVIAGCTEIELLITPADVDFAYFPTTRLHALAAVDAALVDEAP